MILLNNVTSVLKIVTAGAQAIDVTADWMDDLSGTITPGTLNTQIASATTTTVVVSPAGSTSRNVKTLTIRNTDASASDLITVERYDGTTTCTMWQFTLPAGYSWSMIGESPPVVTDAGGGQLVNPLAGRFLKRTMLTATSSSTFTTGPNTNSCYVRQVGGGGAGGGNPATTGSIGAGGGAGAYAEYTQAVTPNTGYSYQCGTGGTGSSGAAGGNGASTTSTIGTVLVTSPAGSGGAVGVLAVGGGLGGAGGTVSTQGSSIGALLSSGANGQNGTWSSTIADACSGAGASSPFGGGGPGITEATNSAGNSAAALGYGGGGGGSATSAATARAGGAGAQGCIVVEEYS
jgi:hypothetical protein